MPKVSVIMPVYNGSRYIGEAIESVQAQTFPDWELIVIDDGSTDETPGLLKGISDPRVKPVRQENQGEAVARNTGLERAQGEYIAFLDADDLFLPNALEDLVNYMEAHPEVDVVLSDGYFCDASGAELMRLSEHRRVVPTDRILEFLVLDPSVVSAVISTLTRRSKIESRKVRFDSSLVIGPDYDFWIQLARFCQFGYLNRLTCKYRIHETNITRTSGWKKRKADLAQGKIKILNSDWFPDLPEWTQYVLLYELLVNLLSGETARRHEVIETAPFQQLPGYRRADLLRHVATDHLIHGGDAAQAQKWLEQALMIRPSERKSYLILKLLKFNRPLCISALLSWQALHQTGIRIRSFRRKRPRPAPSTLKPVTD